MKLEVGQYYIGKCNSRTVKYLGLQYVEDCNEYLHQFEYLKYTGPICGYGQTEEQLLKEKYKLVKSANILYGAKNAKK